MEENLDQLTPDEVLFLRLMERALNSGEIREDELRERLNRLGAAPEIFQKIREQLLQADIRILTGGEEPRYTPQACERILALLEQEQRLSERERLVLTLRLREGQSTEEVAQKMGVTRQRILQVERKAVRLLSRRKKFTEFYN